MVKYDIDECTRRTIFSFSDGELHSEFITPRGNVLTIEQGEHKIVLSRQMIDRLPKLADRWKVK